MEQPEKNPDLVKKAIVRAIVFFDLLDYPLTLDEVWRNLFYLKGETAPSASAGEVQRLIDNELIGSVLEQKNGFYFLSGRMELVASRMKGQVIAAAKYKSAARTARFLAFIPGVKLVAVCNSLAMGNVREESDIDFFIVTAKSRIWLTRLLVTAMTQLLGVRRHKHKVSDRACLSFYAAENALAMEKVALPVDPYFCYWLATLDPVLDNSAFGTVIRENSWLKNHLPDFSPKIPHDIRRAASSFWTRLAGSLNGWWFYSPLGDRLEKTARFLQLKKMSRNTDSLSRENDTRVIISDTMLKFHETDRRQEFLDKWENKLDEIYK